MKLMILDTETSGLTPDTGKLLEVATAIYDVEHRSITRCRSWLVRADENPAEAVNGIPASLVAQHGCDPCYSSKWVAGWADGDVAAIVAHNADFDRQWFGSVTIKSPWVDSQDFAWPRSNGSKSLVNLALAHGLGVGSAHRAIEDVLLLARLLTRAAELGMCIEEQVHLGLRPRALFQVAATGYDPERNALAKEHGFRFDAETKTWRRRLALDDVATIPFEICEVAA